MIVRGLLMFCAIACSASALALPGYVDPMTARMSQFCQGRQKCMRAQRAGVQAFLYEITLAPRPSRARIQWCLARATNKKRLTDWSKAAKCIR
jgi:hypothetical protein